MTTHTTAAKASYTRPQLTVFGSVRNLTGGSSGGCDDAGGIKTPFLAPGVCPPP